MATQSRLIPEWLKRLLATPTAELSRWQYAVRFFLELCRHGARQLREDRASQMAAALAFRTIFGLVPVVIIAMLIFRSFGGSDTFGDLVSRLLSSAKLDQVTSPDKTMTLAEWTRDIVQNIDASVKGRAIGVIGGLVLAWAAIGLMTTVERSFNVVCRAQEHRSLARRIPLYWTAITIGPALLYLSFHLQKRFVDVFQHVSWGGSLAPVIGLASSFLSVWLLLLGMYLFVPHAKVKLGAATAGAFVAAVLWTGATNGFKWYVANSFGNESSALTILYGSLGLIPLFLLWVYFLWLVVLYGLEISAMLQTVGTRMDKGLPSRSELPALTDPTSIIQVMQVMAERFDRGLITQSEDIVTSTGLSGRAVGLMLDALTGAGMLHQVEGRGGVAHALARPPGRITTSELLEIAQRLTGSSSPGQTSAASWVEQFRKAQLESPLHRPLTEV